MLLISFFFFFILLLLLLLLSQSNGEIVHLVLFTKIFRSFFSSTLSFLSEYLDISLNDHIAKTKSFRNGNPEKSVHTTHMLYTLLFILYAEMGFYFV